MIENLILGVVFVLAWTAAAILVGVLIGKFLAAQEEDEPEIEETETDDDQVALSWFEVVDLRHKAYQTSRFATELTDVLNGVLLRHTDGSGDEESEVA